MRFKGTDSPYVQKFEDAIAVLEKYFD